MSYEDLKNSMSRYKDSLRVQDDDDKIKDEIHSNSMEEEKAKIEKEKGNGQDEMQSITIHGREYIPVSERVRHFHKIYPTGHITTELLKNDAEVVVRAAVWPETDKGDRYFTAHSQAVKGQGMVNETAAMENAETSAVGRALGFLGIGIVEGIASSDEIAKAGQPVKQIDSAVNEQSVIPTMPSSRQVSGQKWVCDLCGADAKWSQKKQKHYCPNTKQHLEDKERWSITTQTDKAFSDSLPEENPLMEM